jgi:hypothetical protein
MQMFVRHCLLVFIVLFASSASHASDGRVIDAKSHIGIPNATVTVGNHVVTTDGSGRFHFEEASETTIMARAPGYRAARALVKDTETNGTTIPLTPFIPRALYLTVYGIGSQTLRGSAMALARGGQINALVIDLKGDRGFIPYPTAVSLAHRSGARSLTTIRNLALLASELHRTGIYAIARIVVFKDNPLAEARSGLAVKRGDGSLFRDREGLAWVDPFQAEVRNYNIEIAIEAAQAGFDEIQFDYVRFPDVSQRLRFAQMPTEEMRVQAIDRFLAEARDRLVAYNVFLGVDIFGYVCWNTNDTGIGQQLEHIVKIVDYLSPMVYPSGYKYGIPGCQKPISHPYEIVRDTLENARLRAGISHKRFRPWLQAFRDYAFDRRAFGPFQVSEQIRAADEFGTDGWMLWNPHNRYDGLGLDTLHPQPDR